MSSNSGPVSSSGSSSSCTSKFSVEDVIAKAQELAGRFEYDLAIQFYLKALELSPENSQVLDALGALYGEVGNHELAVQSLTRSVELRPSQGHEKYLTLAQFLEGVEALNCYQQGLNILKESRVKDKDKAIASVLVAMAEIFMTDCCFEDHAEETCGRLLEEALAYDKNSAEVFQALASYKISQSDKDQALNYLEKAISVSALSDTVLTYEHRIQTCKLLIELQQMKKAADHLEALKEELDTDPELWYLLAFAHASLDHKDDAVECLTTCLETMKEAESDEKHPLRPMVEAMMKELNCEAERNQSVDNNSAMDIT